MCYTFCMIKECETCKEDYNAKRSSQKYCKKDCQSIGMSKKDIRVCVRIECGMQFEVKPAEAKKYCSSSCAAIVNNVKYPKRELQGSCQVCGESISSGLRNCEIHAFYSLNPSGTYSREIELTAEDIERRRLKLNEYMRDRYDNTYLETRIKAVEFMGGECVNCGSAESLEFDHIDPKTKKVEVSSMWDTHSWEAILDEMSKCQLLCKLCHAEKTKIDLGVPHGGGVSGKSHCPCELCKAKKREYHNTKGYNRNRSNRKKS